MDPDAWLESMRNSITSTRQRMPSRLSALDQGDGNLMPELGGQALL